MILLGKVIIKLPPPASLNDIRKRALGLKFLVILYSTPARFLNKVPISLPWLLTPFCDFLSSQQVVFALCDTCFNKSVLCSGFHLIITNCRVLSILHDYFSEVFEKDMCSSLHHLVAYNRLLVSEQHGFRWRISTEHTALKRTNYVFLCSNQKYSCQTIFCDLAKAFLTAWLMKSLNLIAFLGQSNSKCKLPVQKFGRERGFNVMNITLTKQRVKIFNNPYFCGEIIPNSMATKFPHREYYCLR